MLLANANALLKQSEDPNLDTLSTQNPLNLVFYIRYCQMPMLYINKVRTQMSLIFAGIQFR